MLSVSLPPLPAFVRYKVLVGLTVPVHVDTLMATPFNVPLEGWGPVPAKQLYVRTVPVETVTPLAVEERMQPVPCTVNVVCICLS
jgi:hypothetical protein